VRYLDSKSKNACFNNIINLLYQAIRICTGVNKPKKGDVKLEVLHGANISNLDFAPGAPIESLRYG
jgi:hypothetical protein